MNEMTTRMIEEWTVMNQIAEEFLYDEDDADTGTNEDETTSASSASHRRGARLEAAVMVGADDTTTSRCDSDTAIGEEVDTTGLPPSYYWTPTEEQELRRGIELYGMKATKLATLLPGRSDSAIRNYCLRNAFHRPPTTTTRDTAQQQLRHDRGLLLRSHTDTSTTTGGDDDDGGGNDEDVVVVRNLDTNTTTTDDARPPEDPPGLFGTVPPPPLNAVQLRLLAAASPAPKKRKTMNGRQRLSKRVLPSSNKKKKKKKHVHDLIHQETSSLDVRSTTGRRHSDSSSTGSRTQLTPNAEKNYQQPPIPVVPSEKDVLCGGSSSTGSSTQLTSNAEKNYQQPQDTAVEEDIPVVPSEKDVLCDGAFNLHPGNKRYRAFIELKKPIYNQHGSEKQLIARSVIEAIREGGGRFLLPQEDEEKTTQRTWTELSEKKTVKKVATALIRTRTTKTIRTAGSVPALCSQEGPIATAAMVAKVATTMNADTNLNGLLQQLQEHTKQQQQQQQQQHVRHAEQEHLRSVLVSQHIVSPPLLPLLPAPVPRIAATGATSIAHQVVPPSTLAQQPQQQLIPSMPLLPLQTVHVPRIADAAATSIEHQVVAPFTHAQQPQQHYKLSMPQLPLRTAHVPRIADIVAAAISIEHQVVAPYTLAQQPQQQHIPSMQRLPLPIAHVPRIAADASFFTTAASDTDTAGVTSMDEDTTNEKDTGEELSAKHPETMTSTSEVVDPNFGPGYEKLKITTQDGKQKYVHFRKTVIAAWNRQYEKLVDYRQRQRALYTHHTHQSRRSLFPSLSHSQRGSTEYKLAEWIMVQKKRYRAGRLPDIHVARLTALKYWYFNGLGSNQKWYRITPLDRPSGEHVPPNPLDISTISLDE